MGSWGGWEKRLADQECAMDKLRTDLADARKRYQSANARLISVSASVVQRPQDLVILEQATREFDRALAGYRSALKRFTDYALSPQARGTMT